MPPNVLIVMTDQQYGGAMSCAGNRELSTPAMDRIAAAGVRFDLAYCTYPLCIPARQSILTGRMPAELGYRQWGDSIDPRFDRQQLGYLFRDAGYRCVYGGKLHAPTNDPSRHGFECICGQDDTTLAQACVDFLEGAQAAPFLMVASFDNPHNICEWARHQELPWGNVPDAPVGECPGLPVNFAIPPAEPEAIRVIQSREPGFYPVTRNTPDDWRQYLNAYYRLIEKADAGIGRILDALHASGLWDDTLIVFTSDHGDGHGAHQWNQKSILYEECVRVPLIVSCPGPARRAGVDSRHLVSNGLDLLPTLCGYAGVEPPDPLPGRSLRPLIEQRPGAAWREELVVETMAFEGEPENIYGRMLRTLDYKYVVYSWGSCPEQLFDLRRDPGEMVNLAADGAHREILREYRERLRRHCAAARDGFAPFIPPAG